MTFDEVFEEMLKRYSEAQNKIEIMSAIIEEQESYIATLEQKLKRKSKKKLPKNSI